MLILFSYYYVESNYRITINLIVLARKVLVYLSVMICGHTTQKLNS